MDHVIYNIWGNAKYPKRNIEIAILNSRISYWFPDSSSDSKWFLEPSTWFGIASCKPLALQWSLSLVQSVPSLRESWVSLIFFFLPLIDHTMKLLIAIFQLLVITCIAKNLDNFSASFIYANLGLNLMATGGEDNIHSSWRWRDVGLFQYDHHSGKLGCTSQL